MIPGRGLKIFLVVFTGLVLMDVIILNQRVFLAKKTVLLTPTSVVSPQPTAMPSPAIISEACPAACLLKIEEKLTSEKITTPTVTSPAGGSVVKEIYIPLGSGSSKSSNWEELPGVEAVIDSANFSEVSSLIFEASLRIPSANGRVYAKLYDMSGKHDVWFSEVSSEGTKSYRAESAKISLSSGRNLYRVMIKSTMSYEAILDWARLKIILK